MPIQMPINPWLEAGGDPERTEPFLTHIPNGWMQGPPNQDQLRQMQAPAGAPPPPPTHGPPPYSSGLQPPAFPPPLGSQEMGVPEGFTPPIPPYETEMLEPRPTLRNILAQTMRRP